MDTSRHQLQDARSLELHREAVRLLIAKPELAQRALDVLDHWETVADPASAPLRKRWRQIIEQRLWHLAVEEGEQGNQLRQASPLGFVLSAQTRNEIMERYRALRARPPR